VPPLAHLITKEEKVDFFCESISIHKAGAQESEEEEKQPTRSRDPF
jgi:hypothetical protein